MYTRALKSADFGLFLLRKIRVAKGGLQGLSGHFAVAAEIPRKVVGIFIEKCSYAIKNGKIW